MTLEIIALIASVVLALLGKTKLAMYAFIVFLFCNLLAIMAYAVSNMKHSKPQSTSTKIQRAFYSDEELEQHNRYYARNGYFHPSFNPDKVYMHVKANR